MEGLIWPVILFVVGFVIGDELEIREVNVKKGQVITITNPGYPDYDRTKTNVVWRIKGPENGVLSINCPQLDISRTERCEKGFFTIDDDKTPNQLCGDHRHISARSSTFSLHIKLIWAVGIFKCNIESLDKTITDIEENRVLLMDEGTVYNGISVSRFDRFMKRRWIITTERSKAIELTCAIQLTNLYDDRLGKCEDGSLTVNLGLGPDGKDDVRTFCKSEYTTLVSHGKRLTVDLETVGSSTGSIDCKAAQYVKNFREIPSEEINSSEFGMKEGVKKTTCNCGRANKPLTVPRIMFGNFASEAEFPWIVSVQINSSGSHFCGGTILTHRHVVTAAHCVEASSTSEINVVVGVTHLKQSKTARTVLVERIVRHNFTVKPMVKDIAILITIEKIEFNNAVGPVCLPKKDPKIVGKYITITGWGSHGEGEEKDYLALQKTHLRVVDPLSCRKFWSDHFEKDNSQICTWSNRTNSCYGDSGGPVVWLDEETNRYFLVGLVSYGGQGCLLSAPTVHTALHYYHDWILKVISEHEHPNEQVCTKIE